MASKRGELLPKNLEGITILVGYNGLPMCVPSERAEDYISQGFEWPAQADWDRWDRRPGPQAAQDEGDGPAPHIHLEASWVFRLGKKDSLLVLKALGGRLANDVEEREAEALGDRLTLLREKEAKTLLQAMYIPAEGVRKKVSG